LYITATKKKIAIVHSNMNKDRFLLDALTCIHAYNIFNID